MKHVRFNIFRKAAFAGALLPYNIYINGEFVGTIKNGKTLNVDVPEADIYYLEDNNSFERNAVIINSNTSDYYILIKRAGGWRTDSYNEFYIDNGDTIDQLPSFHFNRFMNAVFNDSIDQLSSDEQVLALCLNFSHSIMDDIQEVLASSNLSYTIEALKTIGANRYVDLLTQVIDAEITQYIFLQRNPAPVFNDKSATAESPYNITGKHTIAAAFHLNPVDAALFEY